MNYTPMINVGEVQAKIISFLKQNGPSIPIKIAKEIKMEPLFASAILSELTSSHKVKTSHLKVGASQIFYLEGQEQQLETFAEEYLKGPEKQAYLILKNKKYLVDNNQDPAIRVALRAIKDFATPFKHNEEIMWRYNFFPKEEIAKMLSTQSTNNLQHQNEDKNNERSNRSEHQINPQKESSKKLETNSQQHASIKEESTVKSSQETLTKQKETDDSSKDKQGETQSKKQQSLENQESLFEEKKTASPQKTKQSFADEVKTYLQSKNITLLEEIDESRNEYIAKISIDSTLGETGYFLVARNKKSLNKADILAAYQQANEEKMPCFILHRGKVSKKTMEKLVSYKDVVKIESF